MDTETPIEPLTGVEGASRLIAPWATDRFGLITRRKLLALGLSRKRIAHLVDSGHLLPTPHRGVYRVGHEAHVPGQREALALAASGRHAVLHGWSAAAWLGLCDPPASAIRIITPTGHAKELPDAIRTTGTLTPLDVAVHRGLRTTTTLRTLLDLPTHAPRSTLREALVAALRQGHDLHPLHATSRGRRGARLLRQELELLFPELAHTPSELEARFLRLLEHAGVQLPKVNTDHHSRLLDCRWPTSNLIVELDGRRWHEHRFQQDRDRDNAHTLDGLRTLRFTWRDLTDRPAHVLDQVRRALAA